MGFSPFYYFPCGVVRYVFVLQAPNALAKFSSVSFVSMAWFMGSWSCFEDVGKSISWFLFSLLLHVWSPLQYIFQEEDGRFVFTITFVFLFYFCLLICCLIKFFYISRHTDVKSRLVLRVNAHLECQRSQVRFLTSTVSMQFGFMLKI